MQKPTNDYLIYLARRNVLAARQQHQRAQLHKAQQLRKVACKHAKLTHL